MKSSYTKMTLAEAERILDQAEAGRIPVDDPDVRLVLDDANRRVSRDLVWGPQGDPARRRTVQVLIATLLLAISGATGLVVPLLIAASGL